MPTKTKNGEYVIFTDEEEGNTFAIIAYASKILRQIYDEDAEEEIKKYREKALSGDYESLKKVTTETTGGLLIFGKSYEYNVTATQVDESHTEEFSGEEY